MRPSTMALAALAPPPHSNSNPHPQANSPFLKLFCPLVTTSCGMYDFSHSQAFEAASYDL
jgi:hypothetical protein